MTRKLAILAALVALASCRGIGYAPMYIVNELAPNGTLRAAINFGNAALAQKDPKTGEAGGVSVELARELAWRLQVPLDIVPYDAAGKVTADVKSRIANDGGEPVGSSPEEFRAFMAADLAKWAKLVKESGAKLD